MFIKGYKASKEHRIKNSLSKMGHSAWNKGKKGFKHTEESIEKIRVASLGKRNMLGKKHSLETKLKMSKTGKGKTKTVEWKEKIAKSHTGIKHTEETKAKLSIYWTGKRVGKLNSSWLGGKSFEPYTTDWTNTLKQAIRERDNFVCQVCNEGQKHEALSVHHIDYNKKNCNPTNLISLCRKCHLKTNYNRGKWQMFFGGKKIIDDKGVEWIEVPIKKEQGKQAVEAFGKIGLSPLMIGAGISTGAVIGDKIYDRLKAQKEAIK